MTTPTRLERTLPEILGELAAGPTPDYLDDVFARTAPMRQRPGWTFPERWLPMADITRSRTFAPAPPWRLIALALVVIALIAVALFAYAGAQRRVPAPFGPASNGLIPYISGGDIHVGDPVTGATRLLLSSPPGAGAAAPGFSPDGTRLAFVRDVPQVTSVDHLPVDVYVMHDDGSDVTKITSAPLSEVVWATWTPDGRHLAVIHPIDGVNQLDLLDIEGRQPPQRLTAAVGADSIAFRPPDGGAILFRALVDGKYGLFVMDADGSNPRTLVRPSSTAEYDQDLNAAVYSADGSRIFYQRWTPSSIQLWVMNADGTDPHEFIPRPGMGWDGIADPSPDGRWVAFWSVSEDGSGAPQKISVVRADGSGPIIQTGPELSGLASWVWSPDSTKILMMPADEGTTSAYLLDPAGGPWTKVPWTSDLDLDWQRLAP